MSYSVVIASCKEKLSELDAVVTDIEMTVLSDGQGTRVVVDNVNFFVKSFLITLCTNLETCIKKVVYSIAIDIDSRLAVACVPLAVIEWRYGQRDKKSDKKKNRSGSDFCKIGLSEKEIDELISGNVYRTKDAFLIVGVDLAADKGEWEGWKERVQAIVKKRNSIVHHNDSASDISFGDVKDYIKLIGQYLDFIDEACAVTNACLI